MFNFRSQITQKVLGYFFVNAEAQKYINELARILRVDIGNLARKLQELEREGVIASELRGNQRFFFLNRNYVLLNEVKRLFEVRHGLMEEIREKLKKLKGLKEAYIFGSYAKDRFSAESDIDLLLIGRHSSLEAKRLIGGLQNCFQREFNVVDMAPEEFKSRKKKKDEFVADIFKGKIIKIL